MQKEKFVKQLTEHPDIFELEEGGYNGKPGIFVKNKQIDTTTHFTFEAIQKYDLQFLLSETSRGKNVEQMTRVTGYFSKIAGWNKGKTGELKDRYRVNETKQSDE